MLIKHTALSPGPQPSLEVCKCECARDPRGGSSKSSAHTGPLLPGQDSYLTAGETVTCVLGTALSEEPSSARLWKSLMNTRKRLRDPGS